MIVIYANSPDEALWQGIALLRSAPIESSRVGRVAVSAVPVTTVFSDPVNRVSFSAVRDANPFFHLYEALWMLGGRNDLTSMTDYVARFSDFSDDGATLHGAYGFRWREWFGYDQLAAIITELRANPSTRRAVLTMWDGMTDLEQARQGGKDVPCNTQAFFRVRDGALDLTVCCRSNDMVWGACGANVVHFSFLLEYVALACGLRVGTYYQVSNNFHAYIDRPDVARLLEAPVPAAFPTVVRSPPLFIDELEAFDAVLSAFLDQSHSDSYFKRFPFFAGVAGPMADAHALYKTGDIVGAIALLRPYQAYDWCAAGFAWLRRREAKQPAVKATR